MTTKTPAQIADATIKQYPMAYLSSAGYGRYRTALIAAIETDRAQRAEIDQDWRDDQENMSGAEVVEVEVRVFGEDRTAFFITDFELTEAQAVGMFQGIGEASL